MKNLKTALTVLLTLAIVLAAVSLPGFSGRADATGGNEQVIFDYLTGTLGMNTAAACGVLASIEPESGFNPTAQYVQSDGTENYGICQWAGARVTALREYCSLNGLDAASLSGQLSYLRYELLGSESNAFSMVSGVENSAQGAYEAGYNWAKYFERGGSWSYATRGESARDKYWPKYSGSSAAETPSDPDDTEPEEPANAPDTDTSGNQTDHSTEGASGQQNGTPPTIETQPQSITAEVGEMVAFTVVASDAESYQWQYLGSDTGTWNAVLSSSGKTATYTFQAQQQYDGFTIRCVVSNAAGSVISEPVVLKLNQPVGTAPEITTQPSDQSAASGEAVTLKTAANGAERYQWQWRRGGGDWDDVTKAGGNSASYTLTMSENYDGMQYRCAVSNAAGTVYTQTVTVTMDKPQTEPEPEQTKPEETKPEETKPEETKPEEESPKAEDGKTDDQEPTVTMQPADQMVTLAQKVTLRVSAEDADGYRWQWSTDGATWTDAVGTGSQAKNYRMKAKPELDGRLYRCLVSNAAGTVSSQIAEITIVTGRPVITGQPEDQTVPVGDRATFSVEADGESAFLWQWRENNADKWHDITVSGSNPMYCLEIRLCYVGRQYRCAVTNAAGTVYTEPATLSLM